MSRELVASVDGVVLLLVSCHAAVRETEDSVTVAVRDPVRRAADSIVVIEKMSTSRPM